MIMNKDIKIIAFDADDTLWDCQGHFERVMQQLYDELLPWTVTREEAARQLFATERKNMPLLGFGTKAFTLSMIETALRASHYEMPAAKVSEIQQLCYTLNEFPCTPLPEVKETLEELRHYVDSQRQSADDAQASGYGPHAPAHLSPLTIPEQSSPTRSLSHLSPQKLVCFTKGELLDQEHKLERSGLKDYFDDVVITSDKTQREFRDLCDRYAIAPRELLMVGNSLKSDIAPALAIGAWGVYIPFHVTWELEHTEHFDHERMVQISHFGQLLDIICR